MNAKKANPITSSNRSSFEGSRRANAPVSKTSRSATPGSHHANVRDDRQQSTGSAARDLLELLSSEDVNRASKIAAISWSRDVNALVDVAASDAPTYLRRDALQRIDEVLNGTPLAPEHVESLVSCLKEKSLLAYAVILMDIADFDWCARCDKSVVDALCVALYECRSLHETVLLEDTFTHLMNSRPDLGSSLLACSPGTVHLKASYAPLIVNNVVYLDMTTENNVA